MLEDELLRCTRQEVMSLHSLQRNENFRFRRYRLLGLMSEIRLSSNHGMHNGGWVQNGRMLILEDDPHVGKIMKLIGESSGLDVRLLGEIKDFYKVVRQWNPTHIALDLVMPDSDGVEVLEGLASRRCNAKVIITSGMGLRVLDAAGRVGSEYGLNIAGLLSKPFSAAAMRALLVEPGPGGRGVMRHGSPSGDPKFLDPDESQLREAINNHEFHVVYQPRIECATGRASGLEALVRWVHPKRGVIMPVHFIPLLDKHGLIDLLTEHVLEQAISWFSGLPANLSLSVNLAEQTFEDGALLDRIALRCRALGVAPESLIFAATEAHSMADPLASLEWMTRVRLKGFHLSIDDFGTGYSSVLQLVRLPFSGIKVDKSFVRDVGRSTESRTVIRSIVDLGRSLGLKSTADGVRDVETLEYIRNIGCDFAQGYAIARPMDGDAVREWISGQT